MDRDLVNLPDDSDVDIGGPRSCCHENAGADFSLLSVPKIDAVDFSKWSLWLAMLLVMLDPFYKPLVAVFEYKTRLLSQAIGEKMIFDVYMLVAFLHSIVTFVSFLTAVREQPWCAHLQSNPVLLFAYGLLVVGVCMKVYALYSYSWKHIHGAKYFETITVMASNEEKHWTASYWDPYYHPNGTASLVCLSAISLLRASLAGLIICVVLVVAYTSAYKFEQFLLHTDWSKFMKEFQFTKIKSMKNK